jgi:glutamine synthetase
MQRLFKSALNFRTVPKARSYSYANLGSKVFTDQVLRNSVSSEVYEAFHRSLHTSKQLEKSHSDEIAHAIQKWAMSKGCVNFSHWFTPLRGATAAQKLDSFIDRDRETLDLKIETCGSKMFRGETDGSSYPNGGLRATHMAASYTAWDATTPPFILDDTIYFPSIFVSWTGDSMDTRTPLLRSQRAVDKESVRLLRLLGDAHSKKVVSTVGWEQEFFVIDRDHFSKRPDLLACGRTLIGALPSRNQQTEVNYFASIPLRVKNFLKDVQSSLWELGVPLYTMHNEVAPGQHEICPIFTRTNVATDQNIVSMEVLSQLSHRHGLSVLFHEKPFQGLNGSGKHNNWGLETEGGTNLFVPGKTKTDRIRFFAFLAALTRTIDLHGDVLRLGIATPGNDYRLGGQEAPPSIMSLYIGEALDASLRRFMDGEEPQYGGGGEILEFGEANLFGLKRSHEDRNRTAVFPYCGNRFEFRAVGSSQNIQVPLSFLNTAMADSLAVLCDQIQAGKSNEDAVRDMFKKHYKVVFNGNGYSEEWKKEANQRGLWNLPQTVDALKHLTSKKNVELFTKTGVLNKLELECRSNVMYDQFVHQTALEADCLLKMITTGVIPAIFKDLETFSKNDSGFFKNPEVIELTDTKEGLYLDLIKETKILKKAYEARPKNLGNEETADYYEHQIRHQMLKLRKVCDQVERTCQHSLWPFPKYENVLFDHHVHGEKEFFSRNKK